MISSLLRTNAISIQGYLNPDIGINLSNAGFPKVQLVGVAFIVPMAKIVMDQPEGEIWRQAVAGQLLPHEASGKRSPE